MMASECFLTLCTGWLRKPKGLGRSADAAMQKVSGMRHLQRYTLRVFTSFSAAHLPPPAVESFAGRHRDAACATT